MPPNDFQQEALPIQLPHQPLSTPRNRRPTVSFASGTVETSGSMPAAPGLDSASSSMPTRKSLEEGSSGSGPVSSLAWLSRVITKAGQDERLHYHPNGQRQHCHHHHHHHHHHNAVDTLPLRKQLFSKANVVTLEKKYATVHWAAEFYCTITSPFFALPVLLYLDPSFRWSAPEIHSTHFTIALSVLTALTSTLYHATLYKIFSSLDACLATIMFYLNTIHLLRSLPSPSSSSYFAMPMPDLIASGIQWEWTPYVVAVTMITLFLVSWRRTAMLSLLLMVVMIPPAIWGFIIHESWTGLAFGVLGLAMFAADRFKFFCGHSYWHLAGGIALWHGIASSALAPSV